MYFSLLESSLNPILLPFSGLLSLFINRRDMLDYVPELGPKSGFHLCVD